MGWGGEKRQREISQAGGEKNSFPFLFFCGSYACGILVLWSWIKPVSPAMEAQSLNYWPSLFFFLFVFCFHLSFPVFLLIVRSRRLQSEDLRAFKAETQEDQPSVATCCILKSLLYPLRDESEKENSY